MGINVAWANEEQTQVLQQFEGKVTADDYYNVVNMSANLLNSVTHAVDIIMDVRTAKTDMAGFLRVSSYSNKKVPGNQRLVIVVGANKFMQKMVDIASHIAPKAIENVHFVDTMDKAMTIIAEQN